MKSKAEMMKRLRAERKKAGMVHIEGWVPAEKAVAAKRYLARLAKPNAT